MNKFYKQTYQVEVLSDEPLGECLSLTMLDYEITEGHCIGRISTLPEQQFAPIDFAKLCREFGSEPEFFQLNDAGQTIDC